MPSFNSKVKVFTYCTVSSQLSLEQLVIHIHGNQAFIRGCVLVFDIGPHLEHFSLSSYPPFHSLTFPSSLFTSFQSHQLCVNVTPPAGLFFFLPLGVVCELKAGSDSVTCDGFSSIIHWSSHQKEARS